MLLALSGLSHKNYACMMLVLALQAPSPTALLCSVTRASTVKTQTAIHEELPPVHQLCYDGTAVTPVVLLSTEKAIWCWFFSLQREQMLLRLLVMFSAGLRLCVVSCKPLLQSINQVFHGPIFPILIHSHQVRFDLRQLVERSHNKPREAFHLLPAFGGHQSSY